MQSVADSLRRETVERVRALSVAERIALALSLGDEDLLRYMRASGRNREEALRELKSRHAAGRTPSLSATAEP